MTPTFSAAVAVGVADGPQAESSMEARTSMLITSHIERLCFIFFLSFLQKVYLDLDVRRSMLVDGGPPFGGVRCPWWAAGRPSGGA
jgi:hypothetical protein